MAKVLEKIISGGQTGADMAGLIAAESMGLDTGGWATRGYRTEAGPRPETLGSRFGLEEHSSDKYPPRTAANVKESDATLIIASSLDGGSKLTAQLCLRMRKPGMQVSSGLDGTELKEVAAWLRRLYKGQPIVLNVAGNRESKSPGLQKRATSFLIRLIEVVNA